ncbi:MAG: glycosyltransferase family 39 protein [Patescibacteria group bacterium]|nr:glycosyltransferase family 39 protein [Patescibacteria group bacterium]
MLTKQSLIILAVSLGIAVILLLQVFNLTTIALWHDEAFSALLIQQEFSEMMERIGQDVHPPLYYILLRPWADVFENSLLSLRLFSLFFGLLSIIGTYILAQEIFRKRSIAFLSSLFMFFNAFQIQYNMEARMYTLGTFFAIISSIFLLKGLRSKSLLWWLLYIGGAVAAIYTHYYLGFILLAQGAFALFYIQKETGFSLASWIRNKNFRLLSISVGLIILSFLPWLPTFLTQIQRVQDAFWIPSMTIWSIPYTLFKMFTSFDIDPAILSIPLVGGITAVLVLSALLLLLFKYKQTGRLLILFSLIIPFSASLLLSLKTSIYLDRYFILFLPFLLIAVASAIISIKSLMLRSSLITILTLAAFTSFPIYWQSINADAKPGMAAASQYLNESVEIQDKLIVNSSFIYFTFQYYNTTSINPLLYAPGDIPHFSGTALLNEEDLLSDFNKAAVSGDTVWTLDTTGFGNFQPSVPSSWAKESEKIYQDAPDFKGVIIVRKYIVE